MNCMSNMDVMKFQDWLQNKDTDVNWTVVAQNKTYQKESLEIKFVTTSILAEADSSQHLVAGSEWLTRIDFGNIVIENSCDDGKLEYIQNINAKFETMSLEPFVIRKTWYDREDHRKFEIIQDFILFYNLFFDEKDGTYNAIADTGEIFVVVKTNYEKNDEEIKISTKFLRNYLVFKNRILVRQHHHRTCNTEKLDKIGDRIVRERIKNTKYNFELVVDNYSLIGFKSSSYLIGRDILLPFKEQKHFLGWSTKYCEFIIGVDDQGNNIEKSCKKNIGGVDPMSPVFFKREVLKKYHDAPSKYSVESDIIYCGGFWNITIDTNTRDLIQVWIVDLSDIPYHEQQHWKLHNVPPEGGITKSRMQRDIYAKFAESDGMVPQLKRTLSEFQEKFANRFGFKPFMQLRQADKFIENIFRIPLTNETPEFEQQIIYLAKMFPDSIDITSIKKKMSANGVVSTEMQKIGDKKIVALESFLKSYNMSTEIIDSLHKIQEIRSKGTAHRKSREYEKVERKYGLDKITNIEFFKDLMKDMAKSFGNLSLELQNTSS